MGLRGTFVYGRPVGLCCSAELWEAGGLPVSRVDLVQQVCGAGHLAAIAACPVNR